MSTSSIRPNRPLDDLLRRVQTMSNDELEMCLSKLAESPSKVFNDNLKKFALAHSDDKLRNRVIKILCCLELNQRKTRAVWLSVKELYNDNDSIKLCATRMIERHLFQNKFKHLDLFLNAVRTDVDFNEPVKFVFSQTPCPLFAASIYYRAPVEFLKSLIKKYNVDPSISVKNGLLVHAFFPESGGDENYVSSVFNFLSENSIRFNVCNEDGAPFISEAYHKRNKLLHDYTCHRKYIKWDLISQTIIRELLPRLGYRSDLPFPSNAWRYPIARQLIEEELNNPPDLGDPLALNYFPLKDRQLEPLVLALEADEISDITVFDGTDVEIVEDADHLMLNQIRRSEAAACQVLLNRIKNRQSNIQMDSSIEQSVFDAIRKLLTRPAGRALIYEVFRIAFPLLIVRSEKRENFFFNTCNSQEAIFPALICIDFENFDYVTVLVEEMSGWKKEIAIIPDYLILAHELLHYIEAASSVDFLEKLSITNSNERWGNQNELFVINGIKGSTIISENMLRCEFGLPRRVSWANDTSQKMEEA